VVPLRNLCSGHVSCHRPTNEQKVRRISWFDGTVAITTDMITYRHDQYDRSLANYCLTLTAWLIILYLQASYLFSLDFPRFITTTTTPLRKFYYPVP